MAEGIIFKAMSGFYYVETEHGTVRCRARGRFRHDKITPLAGDRVIFSASSDGEGVIDEILPRKNYFIRPPVANIEQMVIIVSRAIPVTDPFLIDRMIAIAERADAEPIVCINKCDLESGDELVDIYSKAGFKTIKTSAETGEGIEELKGLLTGKISAFTGNSGVGKSSVLNALDGRFMIKTAEISEKLGRGKHTTRHVEFFKTESGAVIADTPGFSAFDTERMELTNAAELQYSFRDFAGYIDNCRFTGCSHTKEKGCAVLEAVEKGEIDRSRHRSYVRLYEQLKQYNEWDKK